MAAQTCFKINNTKKTYLGPSPEPPPALDIEQLEIYAGQTTAVLGYSGSGKSTLLSLLGLLDTPDADAGEITYLSHAGDTYVYGDKYLRRKQQHEIRRRHFGFMFQEEHLLNHFSIADNVALPLSLNGKRRKDGIEIARRLLNEAGLGDKIEMMPHQLSGGEYIRAAVVRAIAHDPGVLFADEPTHNLDPVLGETIMRMLTAWREQAETRTLIIVTHNLRFAHRFCDRFIILKGGRVIRVFDKQQISAPKDLYRCFDR